MRKYCKAYHFRDMRQFSDWVTFAADTSEMTDDTVVYLWDDFTVVISPIVPEKGMLWNTITPEWQHFCQHILHFKIPEDLRYAYEETKAALGGEKDESGVTVGES